MEDGMRETIENLQAVGYHYGMMMRANKEAGLIANVNMLYMIMLVMLLIIIVLVMIIIWQLIRSPKVVTVVEKRAEEPYKPITWNQRNYI